MKLDTYTKKFCIEILTPLITEVKFFNMFIIANSNTRELPGTVSDTKNCTYFNVMLMYALPILYVPRKSISETSSNKPLFKGFVLSFLWLQAFSIFLNDIHQPNIPYTGVSSSALLPV